jgi:hypothetical protein
MTREELVAAVDEEISRLEKVRALLQNTGSSRLSASTFGNRPRKKRVLSADVPAVDETAPRFFAIIGYLSVFWKNDRALSLRPHCSRGVAVLVRGRRWTLWGIRLYCPGAGSHILEVSCRQPVDELNCVREFC